MIRVWCSVVVLLAIANRVAAQENIDVPTEAPPVLLGRYLAEGCLEPNDEVQPVCMDPRPKTAAERHEIRRKCRKLKGHDCPAEDDTAAVLCCRDPIDGNGDAATQCITRTYERAFYSNHRRWTRFHDWDCLPAKVTYDEAVGVCALLNDPDDAGHRYNGAEEEYQDWRLCHVDEILAEGACCPNRSWHPEECHDDRRVWTDTPCALEEGEDDCPVTR